MMMISLGRSFLVVTMLASLVCGVFGHPPMMIAQNSGSDYAMAMEAAVNFTQDLSSHLAPFQSTKLVQLLSAEKQLVNGMK